VIYSKEKFGCCLTSDIIDEGKKCFSNLILYVFQIAQADLRTGEKINCRVHEISAGSSFGDLALVQDCIRNVTIICSGKI